MTAARAKHQRWCRSQQPLAFHGATSSTEIFGSNSRAWADELAPPWLCLARSRAPVLPASLTNCYTTRLFERRTIASCPRAGWGRNLLLEEHLRFEGRLPEPVAGLEVKAGRDVADVVHLLVRLAHLAEAHHCDDYRAPLAEGANRQSRSLGRAPPRCCITSQTLPRCQDPMNSDAFLGPGGQAADNRACEARARDVARAERHTAPWGCKASQDQLPNAETTTSHAFALPSGAPAQLASTSSGGRGENTRASHGSPENNAELRACRLIGRAAICRAAIRTACRAANRRGQCPSCV